MAEPINVECPHCGARFKMKTRAAIGKRLPCSTCGEKFTVEDPSPPKETERKRPSKTRPTAKRRSTKETAPEPEKPKRRKPSPARSKQSTRKARPKRRRRPAVEEEFDEFEVFDDVASVDEWSDVLDEDYGTPVLPPGGRRRSSRRRSKRRSRPINWQKPVLMGGAAMLVVGVLVGLFYAGSGLVSALEGLLGGGVNMKYLPADTEFVMVFKVADAWDAEILDSVKNQPQVTGGLEKLNEELGLEPSDVRSVTFGGGLRNGSPDPSSSVGIIRTSKALSEDKLDELKEQSDEVVYEGETYFKSSRGFGTSILYMPNSTTFVMGDEEAIKAAIDGSDVENDFSFVDASGHMTIAYVPNESFDFSSANLPPTGDTESAQALVDAADGKLEGFALGVTLHEDIDFQVQVNCSDSESAGKIVEELEKLLEEGKSKFDESKGDAPEEAQEIIEIAETLIESLNISRSGSICYLEGTLPSDIADAFENMGPGGAMMMLPSMLSGMGGSPFSSGSSPRMRMVPVDEPEIDGPRNNLLHGRESPARAKTKAMLMQIGMAMHQYHAQNSRLPDPYTIGPNGEPLLSWRVEILPFLGMQELYDEFHHDEPWDSPHNQSLLRKVPIVFASGDGRGNREMTKYQLPIGPKSVFEGNQGRPFREIGGGTSNTIMVVEVERTHVVPWTKPEDYEFDENNPGWGFVGQPDGNFSAVLCDGKVRVIPADIEPQQLLKWFNRNDRPAP